MVGIATGAAYVPQAVRIWKRSSSNDVSILIRFRQTPIVIGMAANIVGNLAVILSALRFRRAA